MEVIISFVLLIVLQGIVWQRLYDPNGLLLRPVIDWVLRDAKRTANVVANTADEMKAYGVPMDSDYTVVRHWALQSFGVSLHHSLGVAFLFAGLMFSSPNLFRLGLSFEIGEDVLHYAQMAYCLVCPPGVEPWKSTPKAIWVYCSLHHVLGLVAGSVAFIYCSNWPDVRLVCFLLLWSVLPCYLKTPLQLMGDLQKRSACSKVAAAIDVFALGNMIYTRFYAYIPLAISLAHQVCTEIPGACYPVGAAFVIALLFHTLSLVMTVPTVAGVVRMQFCGQPAAEKLNAPLLPA